MTHPAPAAVAAEPWVLSIAVLAAIALALGAGHVIRRRGERRRGVLMFIAAAVLLANVLIWAWP